MQTARFHVLIIDYYLILVNLFSGDIFISRDNDLLYRLSNNGTSIKVFKRLQKLGLAHVSNDTSPQTLKRKWDKSREDGHKTMHASYLNVSASLPEKRLAFPIHTLGW
jgi:hypothetical protein